MVALYDTYSSFEFLQYVEKLKLNQFVQLEIAQIEDAKIVQSVTGQLGTEAIVQSVTGQIAQSMPAQFPHFLNLTTLTNHSEILNACSTIEERIFYVLYSHKEKLNLRELRRCLKNHTFASLTGDKHNLSNGLKNTYPQALPMLKDTLFVGSEYPLQVGNSTFKVDLLFFHRGLQCLTVIELKTTKFKPEYMGQLEFYLEALDRDVRRSNENPSIGILLCQEADRSVVEYAMSRSLSPTMIAEYQRQLIPKEVLQHSLEEFLGVLNKNYSI
jgi:hypothetical protein